ncbi:alkaline phosphatase family protein [Cellulomonas soli]|uniref:alkaline phosphatase family protein n=1 Tax=Cellulomonas soli TaxID=931535 RepID=UPI003F831382
MTELQAGLVGTLADQEAAAGFLAPGGPRGLARVLPALASALGHDLHPDGASARRELDVPSTDRVCVVLVDGLGFGNLTERSGHAPFLRRRLDEREPLTSTFPSTTATAMGSFGTGASPGRTAMLGYTVRDPATGQLGNLVSWTGLPPAHTWQQVPTLFEQLSAAGVPVTSVGPQRFAGSGLTEAALRGATYRSAQHLPQRVDAALDALRRPGLVYLYWGDVDKVGHHHGWGSWQWGDELESFDRELARLARGLPAGTSLLVTADHGMVDVDRSRRWDVARHAGLAEGVALVAGEPRALHLHLVDGADPAAVATRWRDVLGDAAVVVPREQAVEGGWFGQVDPHVSPVVGDVVVAMTGRATVVDSSTQTPASLELVGVHGSRTALETLVPFVLVTG